MIQLKNIRKSFDGQVLFENVNLTISTTGIHVFVGESGCGKSTLLNMLAGYEPWDTGEIICEGKRAVIFQNYELVNELNVHDNVYLPIMISENKNVEDEQLILDMLGLNELMNSFPKELSGGQKQRVGIARALFQSPDIILCDEPTESLDQENKAIVMDLLKKISHDCMVLMVTHDQRVIDQYADTVYRFENQNVLLQQEKEKLSFQIKTKENQVDFHGLKKVVHKMIKKASYSYSIFLAILLMCWMVLFGFNQKMFQPNEGRNAVNLNQIYVKVLSNNYDFKYKLKIEPDNLKMIVPFDSYLIDGEFYRSLVVPYLPNELPLEGKEPEGNEVVLNRNLANRFENVKIGDTIKLNYTSNWKGKNIEVKVSGIIDELDIDNEILYYDEEGLLSELHDQKEMKWLEEQATYFSYRVSFDDMEKTFKQMSIDPTVELKSPLYEQRVKEESEKKVYKIVFFAAEIILTIGIILLMVVYAYLDVRKIMKNCSILVSCNASVEEIRKVYLKYKIFVWSLSALSSITLSSLIVLGFIGLKDNLMIFLGFPLILYVFLIILFIIFLSKFKQTNVNRYLKNENS